MWIHVPSTSSVSVAASAASSLGSTQPWLEELARSVTWKTNSVSPASLRRVWKTVPSIRRLSGLTSAPSTQNRGVAEWISSLGDSRASPTASREASLEKMTQGNSQEKSSGLQPDLDTQLSFLKMSPESSDFTGTPYDPNYERWVTRLRKVSSQRQRQALLTSGNGSSSWRTPASQESGIRPERLEGELGSRMYDKETGRLAQYGLPQQVQNWPTVTQDSATMRKKKYAQGGNPLSLEAASWPTPTTQETQHPDAELTESRRRLTKDGNDSHSLNLRDTAQNWPTPDSRSIPQAPTTTSDGHTCSPSCRRLNPLFAEMLMGLPPGWTDDSEPLVMESFQSWRRRLTENLQRVSTAAPICSWKLLRLLPNRSWIT
jgi:hypothetical protein